MRMGVPNIRQLPNDQRRRARSRIGGGTPRCGAVQKHGGGHQQAPKACPRRRVGASAGLWRFKALEGNAQGFDFRFERLPRQAQLGRRPRGTGHPAAALGQDGFDEGAFVRGAGRH
jgi:hypothetical protein